MAYFIVIGTGNNVQDVVDEITNSHLQHNVITSGCLHEEDGNLFYQWTVYDQKGKNRSSDNGRKDELKNLLTNQISQFRTLLPEGQTVQIFVISQCLSQEQCRALDFVCDNLYKIGGSQLSNVSVDLVLLGYNPVVSDDVTVRPNWRHIKSTLGIGANSSFNTNVLYINNMDYKGGATNIDSKLLARFLCHWSKMVSAGGCNPKLGVSAKTYSIGLAEYQYNFEDLVDFFKLSAEERILDRTLNWSPSHATEELCKFGWFKDIDLSLPWLDGLVTIKSRWNAYCGTEYDYSVSSHNQGHTLQSQKKTISEYLNSFLRIFVNQCEQKISEKETELLSLQDRLAANKDILLQKQSEISEDEEQNDIVEEISKLNSSINEIETKISSCQNEIEKLKIEINRNSFSDTNDIFTNINPNNILTVADRSKYEEAKQSEEALINYLHGSEAVESVRKAISNANEETEFPEYPSPIVQSIGMLQHVATEGKDMEEHGVEKPIEDKGIALSERPGCIGGITKWWNNLFKKDNIIDKDDSRDVIDSPESKSSIPLNALLDAQIDNITSVFKALTLIGEVESWWLLFTQIINTKQARLKECRLLMDGEKDVNGNYKDGKEGYWISDHPKSHTLIDMDLVRSFRDTNDYYQEMLRRLEERWFDNIINPSERQTLQELIKHQVIDAIRGKYHTLKWDNKHPFVKENLSDDDISDIISETSNQADFFAEYVKLDTDTIANRILTLFYFNDKRMECTPVDFRKKYDVADDSLVPCYLHDFVNSLCVVKVIGISDPVIELNDFKPKREYKYQIEPRRNYHQEAQMIVADAQSPMEKIRKIYDWLCENIKYDTSKTIHDADTAWEQKRGVCQAYCELFCALGESVGLTIEVICGKSKDSNGKVSNTGHSWIYAFTEGYNGILIDPTWGAGGIDDGGKYHKGIGEDREMWFNVDPARMIYTHYPEYDYWQLQTPQITEEQFSNLPVKYPDKEVDATEELALDLNAS